MKSLLAAALVVLAACVTTEERQARQAAQDHATCQSWGLEVLQDGYAECRALLIKARYAGSNRNTLSDIGYVLQSTAAGMQAYQPPRTTTIVPHGGRMITCTQTGTVINCF